MNGAGRRRRADLYGGISFPADFHRTRSRLGDVFRTDLNRAGAMIQSHEHVFHGLGVNKRPDAIRRVAAQSLEDPGGLEGRDSAGPSDSCGFRSFARSVGSLSCSEIIREGRRQCDYMRSITTTSRTRAALTGMHQSRSSRSKDGPSWLRLLWLLDSQP
jgi:hypothetical protein